MDPQQELYSRLYLEIESKFRDCLYDGALPSDGTPYPFVYLAGNRQSDTQNKTALFGEVQQTIHVWHNNSSQRGVVSAMLFEIKDIARKIEETENRSWIIKEMYQTIMEDKSTSHVLLHGILEITWAFS